MSKIISYIIRRLIKISGQPVLIPFYHAVTDTPLDFTKQLYPPRSVANFKRDLDILTKYYNPISLRELIALNQSNQKSTQNYFHLTFDDGLSNFYDEVAPILIEKKIPASVFLNTDFIDNKALFYRYKASLLLDDYNNSEENSKQVYLKFVNKKSKKKLSVSEYLLGITYQDKLILDELAEKTKYSFKEFLKSKKPYLTVSQMMELKAQGFTFGAHSLDHPLFADLSLEMQLKQARESIDWVTDNLGTDIKAFSFPFEDTGVSKDFFEKMNMDISFGTNGINTDIISSNLQRISFELADENTELYLFKKYAKYLLKVLFGKHIIKRS